MISMTILTFAMAVTLVLAFILAVRTIYRLIVFRITTEHRETILKGTDLLDGNLSEAEIRAVAIAVRHLYDYKFKHQIARGTLGYIRHNKNLPKAADVRDDVRNVSKAFAALVLAENPFCALRIIKILVDRRALANKGPTTQSAFVRAEITVASQLPRVEEDCGEVALA